METNKFYLFACFARSFDSYHVRKKIIHLVSSMFYCEEFNINSLARNYSPVDQRPLFIIRVFKSTPLRAEISVKEHSSCLIEFEIPLTSLISFISASSDYNKNFDGLIEQLIGDHYLLSKESSVLLNRNILNNVLFVFEDINWLCLQLLFKFVNITVSGGSLSRRQFLSTTDFNLSLYLGYSGITAQDIYNSFVYSKNKYEENSYYSALSDGILNNIFHLIIEQKNLESIDKIVVLINKLEEYISEHKGLLEKLKLRLGTEASLSASYIDVILSTEKFSLEYKIESLQKLIEETHKKVSDLNSNLSALKLLNNQLDDLSLDETKDLYYKKYHNDKVYRSAFFEHNGLINKLNEYKQRGFKRSYSTSSRLSVSNNLIGFNKLSIDVIKTTTLNCFNYSQVRNISVYSNFDSIISQNIMRILYSGDSALNTQRKVEKYLIEEQNRSILKKIENSDTRINYNLLNSSLLLILSDSIPLLKKLHLNFISNKNNLDQSSLQFFYVKLLSNIEIDFLINILLGRLLLIISNNNLHSKYTSFTDVSYSLGMELINRYNYNVYLLLRDKNKISFSTFISENSDKIVSSDDPTKIVGLGAVLIGWLLELNLISKKVVFIDRNEKRNILFAGNKISKFLEIGNSSLLNFPVKLPMIVQPKKYSENKNSSNLGGFLLNDEVYIEPLFIENKILADINEVAEKNKIYNMVDNINSVSFSINQEVLDFILKNYKNFDLIIDPDFIHPLESKVNLNILERKELESFKSKKNLEISIIAIAQMFRNVPELYIPVRLDYRGRMYCNVEFLHYQGIDLAKALLKFSKGEKVYLSDINSIKYLKIFGANCYGNKLDKQSFIDRINWIDSNEEDIINFENGKLISEAENKLLFIGFCFEYNKYLEALNSNQNYFITHLPIQLDASCNGFQHLSLLLEETSLAKAVNLSASSWDEAPDDLYTFLALRIKEYLTIELKLKKNLTKELRESYTRITNQNFQNHRKLVKKTLMTIPYNSTIFSNILDMKEEFNKVKINNEFVFVYKKDANIIFKHIDFQIICNSLYVCLYRDFPRLEELLKYFKIIAKISNSLGISIPWNLPSGLTVKQKFYAHKKIKFKPFLYSNDLLNLNALDKSKLNTKKQIRSLMPNLVHSLDAASLSLLIDKFFNGDKNKNFYSIHDCFAVTCNNVHLIYELLKITYYNIYCTQRFLKTFDDFFKESILKQMGEDCYNKENNTINIINAEGEKITLKYPDIEVIFNTVEKEGIHSFMHSSYFIG